MISVGENGDLMGDIMANSENIVRFRKVLPVFVSLLLLGGCRIPGSPIVVDDAIRQEVAGNGKIVAAIEETSNTGSEYESEYVVIDTGSPDSDAAVQFQVSHIESLGWDAGALKDDGPALLSSPSLKVRATVEPLKDFMQNWGGGEKIQPEGRAAAKIMNMIKDSGSLVIVVLTSME